MNEQKVDVLADLRKLANVGEYRELREAMQNCLRPHERAGFADVLQRMGANLAAVAKLIEVAEKAARYPPSAIGAPLHAAICDALAGVGGAK